MLSACSTARPHAPARASAAAEALHARAEVQTEGRVVVRADWDDVLASVNLAAGRVEMAVVRAPAASEVEHATELRFELLTATDEPATLIASREVRSSSANTSSGSVDTPASSLAKTSPSGPTPITLTAHVGRFGDPTRERQLTAAVARRLEQLAGVEVAPGR